MFGTALLIAIVAAIVKLDIYGVGQTMISRPIVAGPIMGLALGDLQTGLIVGGTLEMMFLGVLPIGAAIPPDACMSALIATAFAILTGQGHEAAIALAIPVAMAAQSLQMLVWTLNIGVTHRADSFAEQGDVRGVERMHMVGFALFFLQAFIPAFLAIYFGVDLVKALLDSLPAVVSSGLQIAGGMLPALGFAMLFNMMSTRKLAPYFWVGFALAAFLGLGILGVAVLGAAAAVLHVNQMREEETASL